MQEEWVATGVEDGHAYATTVLVRRPRDRARFSGTVIVEPLHVHGIAPIWIYTAPYLLRSGHALGGDHCAEDDPRPAREAIEPRPLRRPRHRRPDSGDFDLDPAPRRPRAPATRSGPSWSAGTEPPARSSPRSAPPYAGRTGPFDGLEVRSVILAGHSQTGSVTSYYIEDAHDQQRRDDGSAVYDGYFPSGFPYEAVPRRRRADRAGHERGRRRPSRLLVPPRLRRSRRTAVTTATNPATGTGCTSSPAVPHMGTRYAPVR